MDGWSKQTPVVKLDHLKKIRLAYLQLNECLLCKMIKVVDISEIKK